MQSVVGFGLIERECPDAERERRILVEAVARAEAGVLDTGAVGKIRRRQQADRLLPVAGDALLRQVVYVQRRKASERSAALVEGRIVIVDAGQDLRRHPEQHVPDAKARGDRPGGQIGVDIGRGKAGQWRRKRYRAEKSGLALLVSDA